MQVNLDCNKPCPQFGAFRYAGSKEAAEIGKDCASFIKNEATKTLFDYIGATREVVRRGFKQFKTEQNKLTRYDSIFDWSAKATQVVERETGKVMETFPESPEGLTGLDHFGVVKFPGRRLLARLFNPKRFLPYNMILAGEKAKALEQKALADEKAVNELFNI
jgi:hypothetical protein